MYLLFLCLFCFFGLIYLTLGTDFLFCFLSCLILMFPYESYQNLQLICVINFSKMDADQQIPRNSNKPQSICMNMEIKLYIVVERRFP